MEYTVLQSMRATINQMYGVESFEAGWFQYVFANRDEDELLSVYNDLINRKK